MLKIGITGSSGSLGKTLLIQNKKYKFLKFKGDIRNKEIISKWVKKNKFNAIIHLAAIVPIKVVNSNKKKAYDVNFLGTKNLVDILVKEKIQWFFFSSTSHVYSSKRHRISEKTKCNPISYYGKTKKLAEDYIVSKLRNNFTKYCIGRIFSTTNANQKNNYLVPDLKRKIKKVKKKILLKNLNHYRDFISMKDLSKIILFLYSIKFSGIINLGSGQKVHLKDIAKIIGKKYRKKIDFKDNNTPSYLIANVKKLKKIYKKKLNTKIEKMIF